MPREARPAALPTLALLTGLNLCNYLDRQVLPAVLSPVERDLRLTDAQFGWTATAFMLGYFLTSPLFGVLGDRFSRRWLIALGILVWCVGTIASGRAGGFAELILFRVVVGVGEASYATISPAWIADLYGPRERNTMLSLFYLAIPVGSALGFIAGGAIAAHYGWRMAFLVAGAPGLVLAAGLLFVTEPKRGAAESGAAPAGSWTLLLRSPTYCWSVAGYVAQTFAMGGFVIWAAGFLERQHHLPLAEADPYFGAAAAGTGLFGTLLGGLAGTAWRRRSPAGYALLLAVTAAIAVPFSFLALAAADVSWSKASLVAAMFFLFLSTGPVNTLILEAVPAALRATAMAASIFAIHLFGDLWSPEIVGWLSDRTGDLRTAMLWTLPPAIAVCAACWAALAVIQLRARPAPLPAF